MISNLNRVIKNNLKQKCLKIPKELAEYKLNRKITWPDTRISKQYFKSDIKTSFLLHYTYSV